MTYYNTTKQKRTALEVYRTKALNQEEIIMEVMRRYKAMTASRLWRNLQKNKLNWPITSVRRSLTNLMNQGVLRKGDLVGGIYGRPEHIYHYNK